MCKHFVSSHKISGVFIITLVFPPVFELLEILNSSFSPKIFLNSKITNFTPKNTVFAEQGILP